MKNSFLRNKRIDLYAVISFLIAAFTMYIILRNRGVMHDGNLCAVVGDLRENYLPAIRNLCRDIKNGESLSFSWNIALGMNTTMYNAYYAYNPFNLLFLIPGPWSDESIILTIIIVKTGLASLCFYEYVKASHGINNIWGAIFAIFYSLCAYQVIFNTMNIIWLDAMFVLPMVFKSIDELLSEYRIRSLILWYSYIFIVQFYMGYMIGLISGLYFLLSISFVFKHRETSFLKILIKYISAVISSIGISAVVWLPTVFFLIDHVAVDQVTYNKINASIIYLYKMFFCKELALVSAPVPNLYCGTLAITVLPLFFISKKIRLKEKTIYGVLLLILLVSCCFEPLYMVWHGFDNPDGWTFRFAFIICFIVCTVSAMSMGKSTIEDIKKILISATLTMAFYISACLIDVSSIDMKRIAMTIIIISAWIALCILCLKLGKKPVIVAAMLLIVSVELIVNYYGQMTPDTLKSVYRLWEFNQNEAVDTLNNDDDFYRVNSIYDYGISSGIQYGYNGISYYSTGENYNTRKALERLGIYDSPRMVMGYGLTPITEMLLGIKYTIYNTIPSENMGPEDIYPKITYNAKALGVGYMVAGNIDDYDHMDKNAFENNNYILSTMTGQKIQPYSMVNSEDIIIEENGVRLQKTGNGYMVDTDPIGIRSEDANLTYIVNKNEKTIYSYVYHDTSNLATKGFLMTGGEENAVHKYGELSASYIKKMQEDDGKYKLSIVPIDNAWRQSFEDIYFAEYNDDQFTKAYELLSDNQLIVDEFRDGYIKGSVSTTGDKKILFTTIPYDKGWKVKINGEYGSIIPLMNEAFIGVELPVAENYTLEFEFEPIGLRLGILISTLSMIICLLFAISDYKGRLYKMTNESRISEE